MIHGPSPDPHTSTETVEYLVEIGDPCNLQSYELGDVWVSDFVLPHYYHADAAGPYSFHGSVTAPHDVLEGGYLTFLRPSDQATWWWKIFRRGTSKAVIEQVPPQYTLPSVREQIDVLASRELER